MREPGSRWPPKSTAWRATRALGFDDEDRNAKAAAKVVEIEHLSGRPEAALEWVESSLRIEDVKQQIPEQSSPA